MNNIKLNNGTITLKLIGLFKFNKNLFDDLYLVLGCINNIHIYEITHNITNALWDILTGLYYYGDDFIIKRKRTHTYTEYGRTIDYTQTIDKVCEIFGEAALEEYSEMTVTIEYMD